MGINSMYWSQPGQAWWIPLGSYMGILAFFLFLGASWWVLKNDAFIPPDMADVINNIGEAPKLDDPEEEDVEDDVELSCNPWKKRGTVILDSL